MLTGRVCVSWQQWPAVMWKGCGCEVQLRCEGEGADSNSLWLAGKAVWVVRLACCMYTHACEVYTEVAVYGACFELLAWPDGVLGSC